jgi:hypothetical protein
MLSRIRIFMSGLSLLPHMWAHLVFEARKRRELKRNAPAVRARLERARAEWDARVAAREAGSEVRRQTS